MSVSFTVRGLPVPQGSSKAFVVAGRARITSASKGLPAWRNAIATAAASAMGERPVMTGPVSVEVCFYLPRPASAPKRVLVPATRPDVDKLLRALLDGITGVVLKDDSLVVDVTALKRFGDVLGAKVEVMPWEGA
jgi:Holliday junction resolvase RusA-like endonuclease